MNNYNVPIMFYPNNTLYNNEKFIPISDDKIKNVVNGRYMISNYGRVYDYYSGLFCIGYLNGDIMYIDLAGINNTVTISMIELVAIMFHEKNKPYARMKDRKSRPLFHKDNIEWTDIDKDIKELDKNITFANNQRIHCGEGSSFPTKLTDEKVHKICKLLEENKLTQHEIADIFHVSHDAIFRIKAGDNWKHISKNYNLPKVIPRGQATGENNPTSKYNEGQIRKICELLEKHQYSNKEIAKMINVHPHLVSQIKNKKTWTDISKEYNIPDIDRSKQINTKKKPDYIVKEICRLLEKNKYTLREIADITDVSRNFVWNIKNRKIRTDISKDYNF